MELTVETFRSEIDQALRSFDRHVVCLEKTPEDSRPVVERLVEKAIRTYGARAAGLRHGIALDRHLTVILSQTDTERPLCGIYFNLCSPYQKKGE